MKGNSAWGPADGQRRQHQGIAFSTSTGDGSCESDNCVSLDSSIGSSPVEKSLGSAICCVPERG